MMVGSRSSNQSTKSPVRPSTRDGNEICGLREYSFDVSCRCLERRYKPDVTQTENFETVCFYIVLEKGDCN